MCMPSVLMRMLCDNKDRIDNVLQLISEIRVMRVIDKSIAFRVASDFHINHSFSIV